MSTPFGSPLLVMPRPLWGRFYGKSVPNNSFSVDNLKYLTVNQALDDMKNFM